MLEILGNIFIGLLVIYVVIVGGAEILDDIRNLRK
jgi:hypothetical protein